MCYIRYGLAAVLLGLALGATPLRAQAPEGTQQRGGFHLGFGYGGAVYDLECAGCASPEALPDPWEGGHGIGAHLRAGAQVSRVLSLGAELGGQGVAGTADRRSNIFHLLLTGQYHLRAPRGFHLAAGVGVASILLGMRGGSVEALGLVARAGAGYDFGIGERFTVTPHVSVGHLEIPDGRITTFGSAGTVSRLSNRKIVQYGLTVGLRRPWF